MNYDYIDRYTKCIDYGSCVEFLEYKNGKLIKWRMEQREPFSYSRAFTGIVPRGTLNKISN